MVLLPAAPALASGDSPAPPATLGTPPTVLSQDRLIVQWAGGADHQDRIAARDDAEVDFASDLGNRRFQLVEVQPGQTANEAVRTLEADPAVAIAERDGYDALDSIPNDPLFDQLWGLRNLGGGVDGFSAALAGADISVAEAWDRTVGSPTTVIADIDSGYRFEHPDLASVAWTNPDEIAGNGVDDDADGIADDVHGADFIGANGESPAVDGNPTDEDLLSGGHGVHTAGTMGAAGDNGVGITGVAQDVRVMPLRVCSRYPSLKDSRCAISSQVAAINYASAHGAQVANMSLGGNDGFQAVVNAIAAAKQTLFVISAGNDGSDNDGAGSAPHGHHYPCDYTPQTQASPPVPGAVDNIVCVAATDQADGLASFSDWGATSVDLGAPGTETLSTYPYVTPFEDTFAIDDFASKWPATGTNGGFERTGESPLASFGMTDVIGPAIASTVRETISAPLTIPPNGGCRLHQTRRVALSSGDHFQYRVLLNGAEVEKAGSEPGNTEKPGLEKRFLDLPAAFDAGGEAQVLFRFTAGSAPAQESGVWLDDISITCVQAVGQADSYGFLEGTSMAAPHVAGAAALLFSREPAATVTEVRDALLSGVDPVPSLAGKTVSGGRLNASKAMDIIEGAEPPGDEEAPAAPQLTSTSPASPANENHPRIIGTAEAGSTVHIYASDTCAGAPVATGTAEELASPGIAVAVPDDSISFFSATATDAALNTSACSNPIVYGEQTSGGETVVEELPPGTVAGIEAAIRGASPPAAIQPLAKPSCTAPRLIGKTLGQAKAALVAAHCSLGKVTKPKARKGRKLGSLVVVSAAGAAGGKVDLTLGPKPKAKKHHH
jgi:subtilisin family serine protease